MLIEEQERIQREHTREDVARQLRERLEKKKRDQIYVHFWKFDTRQQQSI